MKVMIYVRNDRTGAWQKFAKLSYYFYLQRADRFDRDDFKVEFISEEDD